MMGGNRVREECITMHQPWASLLVHGIKRVEGRSWPAPLRGRLWIHAASKVPDSATIKAMEDFYREIYAIHGITDLKFPDRYPVSRLLGCVEVVRLEALTDFCWLCEQPQRLFIPLEMRGYQGVYPLDKKMVEAAIRGLALVQCPQAVKFPLPDAHDPFSLKPGSISLKYPEYKASKVELSSSLIAVIVGATAAATQFSKKNQTHQATQPM
ncbi:ASCH domain, partial [Dillenia turbinata]